MTRRVWWSDFKASDFEAVDPMETIAMLPIAAIEQHGPHLPLGTDELINRGLIAALIPALPEECDLRILPVQSIGKSNEHLFAAGTVTLDARTLIDAWVAIGLSVARAGVKKLVIVNSHGGNLDVMGIVARELRVAAGMLVVKTGWLFGYPDGLVDPHEQRLGIHGGDVETSLMLHFHPELVDLTKAENFVSRAVADEADYKHLRPIGLPSYAWIASDIHPSGAIGDAASADAGKGAAIARHQVAAMCDLLAEVRRRPLPDAPALKEPFRR